MVILLLVAVLPLLHWTSAAMVSACVYIPACRLYRSFFYLASQAQVLLGLVDYVSQFQASLAPLTFDTYPHLNDQANRPRPPHGRVDTLFARCAD